MKIILASASPRRKMILEQLGLEFEIVFSGVKEKIEDNLTPEEIVKSLAYQKASSVVSKVDKDCLIIGSDTIVVVNNEILGKPKDSMDAKRMLRLLSARTHRVITSICVLNTSTNRYLVDCETSCIKMKDITDEEIEDYIKSKEPFDKAGSYAIQGLGAVFVEKIEGSYSAIVGLPAYLLNKMLKSFGVYILGGNN